MSASHQMLATFAALLTVLPSLYLPKTLVPQTLTLPQVISRGLGGLGGGSLARASVV